MKHARVCSYQDILSYRGKGHTGPSLCSNLIKADICSLAEGREPWGGAPVLPSLEIGDHEAGIWALSADLQGRTLVTGTEDGSVAAWDVRGRTCIWQVSIMLPPP